MSIFKRFELLEPSSPLFYKEVSISNPFFSPFSPSFTEKDELGYALHLLNPNPFEVFESAIDLIQIERTPLSSSFRRIHERTETDFYLRSLSDRVSALELGFDRVLKTKSNVLDRKYSLKAEIKDPEKNGIDRKYKWTTQIKGGKKAEKDYKWTAEIKGKGKNAPISHTYTYKASTAPAGGTCGKSEKAKQLKGKSSCGTRVVEIEDTDLALKEVLTRKRAASARTNKGKKKELSLQDAALIIQMSFRAHLVRRSKTLSGLRDLAVAKAKLKELRALYSNFSYRGRIACDAEERQRFSEKIIVLLLTVDAIEGPDHMVRAARRSMVEELEAMLDVVDPQPPGKLGSLKRRKFDLPVSGSVQKEMALGVAEVVQMLDEENIGM
ncbi:BAG family molecular chaperone regulator 7-like [Tasmannia lanceolata]|uniref:BAG family molecular chaperone regulator 7-like n=1 Tax=Tasmannia lanceolata TaxID=3420 RepID=UPI004063B60F